MDRDFCGTAAYLLNVRPGTFITFFDGEAAAQGVTAVKSDVAYVAMLGNAEVSLVKAEAIGFEKPVIEYPDAKISFGASQLHPEAPKILGSLRLVGGTPFLLTRGAWINLSSGVVVTPPLNTAAVDFGSWSLTVQRNDNSREIFSFPPAG